ncbi:DUF2207 domain-containing protein [Thermanaerothrix sp. 4228-RoL]|uniref:DUF2207 domain-containing protein n=1 Tax=Thermanaerothrix solaris TaxID=3058434 RepID=A0ABU3NR48_9CHLR|nr:DUF2207 domain-containing protein [Thermanaerothrix sp. 4228-RoL]MDT8898683.1 DUF2207 domain-containing protein [Thermanaerothrix sp. 4228-RoL]
MTVRQLRLVLLLATLIGLLALLGAPRGNADARAYYAERYDVVLQIQAENRIQVEETVTFRFEGGPYTYAFRQLTLDQLEHVEIQSASLDGVTLPEGNQPNQVEIKRNADPIEITWHFPPTQDATRTLGLRYLVSGHIHLRDNAEGILWQAIPEEHEYTIRQARITVRYPSHLTPAETPQLRGAQYTTTHTRGEFVFTAQDIPANQGITIEMLFPRGSLIAQPPDWQARLLARGAQARQMAPWAIGLGLGVALLSLIGVWLYRRQRQGSTVIIPPGIISNPPDALSPAQAAFLLNPGAATPAQIAAVLIHLAQRGWLRLEATPAGRGLFKTRDYTLHRLRDKTGLHDHEQVLFQALFTTRQGWQDTIRLSRLGNKLPGILPALKQALTRELIAQGLLDAHRLDERKRLNALAVLAFLIEFPLLIVGLLLVLGSDQLAGVGTLGLGLAGGLMVAGSALLLTANAWPLLTPQGETRAARWKGFKQYLGQLVKQRSGLQGEWLEAYLPYALAFGSGLQWAEAFREQGFAPTVSWLLTASGAGGMDDLLGAIAATSVVTSSGGDGGGAGAGGGGGGASGAG